MSSNAGGAATNAGIDFKLRLKGDSVPFFVKDAHDRYANMEVSYYLQRLETFNGLAILATNRRQNIDAALTRRFYSIIEFPIPGKKGRQQIWEQVFQDIDSSELDIAYLASQFKLTSGHIRNIALNTCLQSMIVGQQDPPRAVTMENTLRAVKRELQKMGYSTDRKQFGEYANLVEDDKI